MADRTPTVDVGGSKAARKNFGKGWGSERAVER